MTTAPERDLEDTDTIVTVVYGRLDAEQIEDHKHARSFGYRSPEALAVGDIVMAPANHVINEPQEATIVALGTTYTGELSSLLHVVEHRPSVRDELRARRARERTSASD